MDSSDTSSGEDESHNVALRKLLETKFQVATRFPNSTVHFNLSNANMDKQKGPFVKTHLFCQAKVVGATGTPFSNFQDELKHLFEEREDAARHNPELKEAYVEFWVLETKTADDSPQTTAQRLKPTILAYAHSGVKNVVKKMNDQMRDGFRQNSRNDVKGLVELLKEKLSIERHFGTRPVVFSLSTIGKHVGYKKVKLSCKIAA